MDWQTIRQRYPSRWLVLEAVGAYTEGPQRVIPCLVEMGVFEDHPKPAWERYKELHKLFPDREYYVLHTDREELDIGVMDAFFRVMG